MLGGNDVTLNDVNNITLGDVNITGKLDVTAGTDIALNGVVNVASLDLEATAGDITQTAGTLTVSSGPTDLKAGDDITLDKANDFVGTVNVLGGNDVTLNDANAMTLGTVTTTGKLTLNSAGTLNLGTSKVGGNLSASSGNGNITQIGALIVVEGSVLNAGTGSILLNNAGNTLANGVTVIADNSLIVGDKAAADKAAADKAAQDAVSQRASKTGQGQVVTALDNAAMPAPLVLNAEISSNVAVSSTTNTTNASSTGSANSSAASGINSSGVTVDLLSVSSASTTMMAAVSLPKGASTVGVGFSFALPEAIQALAQQRSQTVDPQPSLPDGSPLPAWLSFDVSTLRFEAQAVPTGAFPLQVLVTVAGSRVMVVISERTE